MCWTHPHNNTHTQSVVVQGQLEDVVEAVEGAALVLELERLAEAQGRVVVRLCPFFRGKCLVSQNLFQIRALGKLVSGTTTVWIPALWKDS